MLTFKNHIGILLMTTLICYMIEFMDNYTFNYNSNTKWYTPSYIGLYIFGVIELGYWIIILFFT